ncbi:ATP-binding protein [Streptomyces erythrochromogenes]|uniref:ATP-binding protein n=1 Tax=Streptomyces erythrochromogenes TaxID=285574 RepID=UPI003644B66A
MTSDANQTSSDVLDLTPSPRLLEVLGDIPYKPWQCLAELIDNAFDDFLSDDARGPQNPGDVYITLPRQGVPDADAFVCVADNGRGMSRPQLELALRAGYSPNSRYGSLGLFGMGFNIATANLGSITEVRTTRAGDENWLIAEINFPEMQQNKSFTVPLRQEPKDDPTVHGTEITVSKLRSDKRSALRRSQVASTIREQLGRVYSYLLRDKNAVPELPQTSLAGRGFRLYVNGTAVKPRLPCIWSSSRTVTYQGSQVKAVKYIDHDLTPAWACQDCGHWHRVSPEECIECGSENLDLRERKIVGWVGIQRYLHLSDFGVDFLRNGRKILVADRDIFSWEHPDTGESIVEYPIEFGSTQGGRIVGEIHLDHVPVTYQKNDFKRESRDWITAIQHIRGEGPLQPRKAKSLRFDANTSAIGELFNAFRRNDPGTKCLIPGEGGKPLHDKAREWASFFRKGLPEYATDEKWFEAAQKADRFRTEKGKSRLEDNRTSANSRVSAAATTSRPTSDVLIRTGLDFLEGDSPGDSSSIAEPAAEAVETEEQRFTRYREHASSMADLSGAVSVAHLGKRYITVYDTIEPLIDHSGRVTPCVSRTGQGNTVEVYVNGDHEVFREFGRDPRDYAVIEIAEVLRALANTSDSTARVAAEVITQFPDQRFTDASMRERAAVLLNRVREQLETVGSLHSSTLWNSLPQVDKQAAEKHAASTEPRLVWDDATLSGEFIPHLTPDGIAALVRAHPELLLDDAVFTTKWSTWNDPEARASQVSRLSRLLEVIGSFLANTNGNTRVDLAIMRLTLDAISTEMAEAAE